MKNYLNENIVGLDALSDKYLKTEEDSEKDSKDDSKKDSLLSKTLKKSGAFTGARASFGAEANTAIYGATNKNNSGDPMFTGNAGLTTNKPKKPEYIDDAEVYLNKTALNLIESIELTELTEQNDYSVTFTRPIKTANNGNSSGRSHVVDPSMKQTNPEKFSRRISNALDEFYLNMRKKYRQLIRWFKN
jgi:hypothetical protein